MFLARCKVKCRGQPGVKKNKSIDANTLRHQVAATCLVSSYVTTERQQRRRPKRRTPLRFVFTQPTTTDATRIADADATGVPNRRATSGKVGHDGAKLPAEFKCPCTAVAIADTGWGAEGRKSLKSRPSVRPSVSTSYGLAVARTGWQVSGEAV